MVDITKRSVKGSPLTNTEVDTNFDNLNTGKVGVEDIGTDPNQVPLNQYLGSMAYQDLENVVVGELTADGLTVDTDTLYVDAANNRVGIGTSSPAKPLHVEGEILSLISGGTPALFLNNGVTQLNINNSSGSMVFDGDGSTERMRIDSSGNVGIGTSSPSGSLHLLTPAGSSGNDNTKIPLIVQENSFSTANLIEFRNSIGGALSAFDQSGNLGIGTNSPSQALDVVGNIEVSGGIYLGGTGAANHLDDYEEGSWTCDIDIDGSTGSGTTGDEGASYVKVGRLVTVTVQRRVSGFTSATGTFTISGSLPFVAAQGGVFKFVNRALTGTETDFGRWLTSSVYVNSANGDIDYNSATSGITVTDNRSVKHLSFVFSYYTTS